MKFEQVYSKVRGIPFISANNARQLYNFILENKLTNCLELGFAHGVASCYLAAALDELGSGILTSVDLLEAKFEPSIEELLTKVGLRDYVKIVREKTGYTWFLHEMISRNTVKNTCKQIYDLCIIDGPKNWTIDGAAFFMVDKLLKYDGWIIFDDYDWTYAQADKSRTITDGITHRELSAKELQTPQIKSVFDLLVMQHPDYSEFKIQDNNWAWAHKTKNNKENFVLIEVNYNYKYYIDKILRKFGIIK